MQAALSAATARLSSAEVLEGYQFELVSQDLKRAKDGLSSTPLIDLDFEQAKADLVATWRGVCEVKWQISVSASRALERFDSARMCVNEIAKEAVSNAVRHGEAKLVSIAIERPIDDLLTLVISNDGIAPRDSGTKGVGLQMLDEVALSWSLDHNRGRGLTELSVRLPLSAL